MDDIKVRWATCQDAEKIGTIHSEGWKVAYKNIIPDRILDNINAVKRMEYFKKALSENKEEIGVLIVNSEIIGFITLGASRDSDLDTSFGEIWGIYLLPNQWNKGYGRVLMDWGIQELMDRGYSKIVLWVLEKNTRARMFYEILGFIEDGEVKEVKIGKSLNVVRYMKQFGS